MCFDVSLVPTPNRAVPFSQRGKENIYTEKKQADAAEVPASRRAIVTAGGLRKNKIQKHEHPSITATRPFSDHGSCDGENRKQASIMTIVEEKGEY